MGDYQKWASKFNSKVIIHEEEQPARDLNFFGHTFSQPPTDSDIYLKGNGPTWTVEGLEDFEIIFVPGHTKASVCYLYKPEKSLFTGDHLAKD